jgi:tagatose 1,6-diphosphate aldolase GatY/KbaY
MLVGFADLVEEQRRRRHALGAFTCYDLETALGVLEAVQAANYSAVILISNAAYSAHGGDQLAAGIRAVVERAPTPVCLQLDHVASLTGIASAFANGFGAVMVDGAKLPLDQNITLARESERIARRWDGAIEVELGHVGGSEDGSGDGRTGALTDPEEVEQFVSATRPACLAISVGNVHGEYSSPPVLDWTRLDAIREKTDVALALHGASGLTEEDLRRAIVRGVTKVNINTDIRQAYFQATERQVAEHRKGWNVLKLHESQVEAVREAVVDKLNQLTPR